MEITKEQYDQLQNAESNKELISAIKQLIPALQKDDNSKILELILANSKGIERLAQALKEMPAPEVNIQTDQGAVIQSISEMARNIIISLDNLKDLIEEKSKAEWHFTVKRGKFDHLIEEITAKQI